MQQQNIGSIVHEDEAERNLAAGQGSVIFVTLLLILAAVLTQTAALT
jgi:hypothetical protein